MSEYVKAAIVWGIVGLIWGFNLGKL